MTAARSMIAFHKSIAERPAWAFARGRQSGPLGKQLFLRIGVVFLMLANLGPAQDNTEANPKTERKGYLVKVDLPLVGNRADAVVQQIRQISGSQPAGGKRAIVVLRFQAKSLDATDDSNKLGNQGQGVQFERCLQLARFLSKDSAARKVRTIAYLPNDVFGHGVLPILACEDMYMAPEARIGRATEGDGQFDRIVESAYETMANGGSLPQAIALSMLDSKREVYWVKTTEDLEMFVGREKKQELEDAAKLLDEQTFWPGGSLADYSGAKLRRPYSLIAATVTSEAELARQLGLSGNLRTVRQLPREWTGISLTVGEKLETSRVNQMIRAINEQVSSEGINLLVLKLNQMECDFKSASRLAGFLADLNNDKIYTLGLVEEPLVGASGLIAAACQECVLIGDATLGPPASEAIELDEGVLGFLDFLNTMTQRPVSLMSSLLSAKVTVKQYVNQDNGRRQLFADWEMDALKDKANWESRKKVAGGEAIPSEIAVEYRLVDGSAKSVSEALSNLGVDQQLKELDTPWIDGIVATLLAQGWLPRLLLTIGFFALMAELGSPGMGAGALLSGLCFLGFFWIEGFNGNVEMLEILLFLGGLFCLAFEIFVVPGFGIFGITGLLMLFVSVVLASQTFIWPTTSAELGEVASNLFWTACMALAGMISLLFMHKHLEHLPMFRLIALNPESAEDLDERESLAYRDHLLGQSGLTVTRLNPSGKAQFGRDIVQVVGAGKLISEGVPVQVVEVRGNVIIVEET
ncbi:MAG: NfeD family protein [Planctomycetota bacterium]|nr:NfeD family protein [Planctomycetota bacterium]